MRTALLRAAVVLAIAVTTQLAGADAAAPVVSARSIAVAGAPPEPVKEIASLSPPSVVETNTVTNHFAQKHIANAPIVGTNLYFASTPSPATLAWAVSGNVANSIVVASGPTSALTFSNVMGELIMPPVGPGSAAGSINVRVFAQTSALNDKATNATVYAAAITRALDTTKVGGTLRVATLSAPIVSAAQLDSFTGTVTVTIGTSMRPALVSGGSIVYYAVDGTPLMTLNFSAGSVTGIAPAPERSTTQTITFNTTVGL